MTACNHLVWGYSPCYRRAGHTGPHHASFDPRSTPSSPKETP